MVNEPISSSHKLKTAFGDYISNPNWIFETPVKEFPDLLADWVSHENCTNCTARFLSVVGLADKIDLQEFDDVYIGHKNPGVKFATLLAQHLPGGALRPSEPRIRNLSFNRFQNAAGYWRRAHPKLPTAEISTAHWAEIRLSILKTIAASTTQFVNSGEEIEASAEDNDTVYGAFSKIASKAHKNADEIIELVCEHYAESPLCTLQTVNALFEGVGSSFSDDTIKFFITEQTKLQTKDFAGSAQALRFLRQNRNLLTRQLGVSGDYISKCETLGRVPVLPHLKTIIKHLGLSPEEIEIFLKLASPELSRNISPDWLKAKIATNDWNALAFPALDSEWLGHQDFEKQPGLLLRDFRKRLHKSRADIGNSIGSPNSLYGWETGNFAITPARLGSLIEALSLSTEEADKFALLVRPGIIEHVGQQWLRDKIVAKDWESISFPALDPQWLKMQDPHKQAPMWLHDYIERSGHTHEKFAEAAGIKKSTLSSWECFETSIDPNKLGSLLEQLKCTEQQAIKFAQLVNPTFSSIDDESWLTEKILAKDWEAISQPALDPKWLSMQAPELQAGLLLTYFRKRAGKQQPEIAESLGVKTTWISTWERGVNPIDPVKIEQLCGVLGLSQKETVRFLGVLPHLQNSSVDWLQQQVAEKRWDNLSSPALDATWLNGQDICKQAGLLLQSYRARLGKMPFEIGENPKKRPRDYAAWEQGIKPIRMDAIVEVARSLGLTVEEKMRLDVTAKKSNEALAEKNVMTRVNLVQMGSSISTKDAPLMLSDSACKRAR